MKRQGAEGEFRSNLHNSVSAEMIKITPAERDIEVKVLKALGGPHGLKVSGVDLARSNRGSLVWK